jgi:hypothetical protein
MQGSETVKAPRELVRYRLQGAVHLEGIGHGKFRCL